MAFQPYYSQYKAYYDEKVPDPLQLPHMLAGRLRLHHLGEQGDEKGTAEKATVNAFILQYIN